MRPKFPEPFQPLGCEQCRKGNVFPISITMAFQPIWNSKTKQIHSQEALVRGPQGEPASWVLDQLTPESIYYFDQVCRVKAIETASRLNLQSYLNINFLPNAVYRPETCIQATLQASEEFGFPANKIIFEVSEMEKVQDESHLERIFTYYKDKGFQTAMDDFGAGYSGLKLLTRLIPDYIKIDMDLIRNVHSNKNQWFVVESIWNLAQKLNISVIAEGIESYEEFSTLEKIGIHLFQGYYFAKPGWESLPTVDR